MCGWAESERCQSTIFSILYKCLAAVYLHKDTFSHLKKDEHNFMPYLLCWPFLMQVLSIFVGKVLEFLWKKNTEKHKPVTHLVCVCVSPAVCATQWADEKVRKLLKSTLKKVLEKAGIGNSVLPSSADWFGVKVALSVNWDGLFNSGVDGGIHIVGR